MLLLLRFPHQPIASPFDFILGKEMVRTLLLAGALEQASCRQRPPQTDCRHELLLVSYSQAIGGTKLLPRAQVRPPFLPLFVVDCRGHSTLALRTFYRNR